MIKSIPGFKQLVLPYSSAAQSIIKENYGSNTKKELEPGTNAKFIEECSGYKVLLFTDKH